MDVLVALLNGVGPNQNDGQDNRLYFTFHASNAYQMNDKIEGTMLLNKFFTESKIKTEYWEQYMRVEEDEGEIYIISLCRSNSKSKDSGSIPMWGMYGNKGYGTILVFDYNKLNEYISQCPNMFLAECQYINSKGLETLTKEKNKEIKEARDKVRILTSLQLEAFELKDWHWEYENEWRILVKSHDSKIKASNHGAVSYIEVRIPVNCVRAIIIGTLVEFDPIKRILDKRVEELFKQDNSININIKHSNLQIR